MAKTKYTEEIVKEILGYLEEFGVEKIAIKLVGINPDTFYEWKKKHPDFSESIKKAK